MPTSKHLTPAIKVHTVEQPDSDISAFILSCNRLHLLEKTFESFIKTRDLSTKITILDDSGVEGVFDYLVNKYGWIADIICFPENRGLWWAKDFMATWCSTPYIFYVEEDWLFLGTGYLVKSKEVLDKYRDIGCVDISWRTFQEEGIDSYEDVLVDNSFYYKKPWQISPNHLHWFILQGSPNLARRDDLILIGRLEKYYNEWNIDRKMVGMGYKGVYLKGRYVTHLGDHESIMAHKRKDEGKTPDNWYPEELEQNRTFPKFDYYGMDNVARQMRGDTPPFRSNKYTLVTSLLDIDRHLVDGRDFIGHYVNGLLKLLEQDYPIVVFIDEKYYHKMLAETGGYKCLVVPYSVQDIKRDLETYIHFDCYDNIVRLVTSEQWLQQAEWIRHSILRDPRYIALTLHKVCLLSRCLASKWFRSENYIWIDSGICHSFKIDSLSDLQINEFSSGKINISAFPYRPINEVHGFNTRGYKDILGIVPQKVLRATIFGGDAGALAEFISLFYKWVDESLKLGYIGTEESIFTLMAYKFPDLFNVYDMPTGDVTNYLSYLKSI